MYKLWFRVNFTTDRSKMKAFFAAVILTLAVAASAENSPVYDYHRNIGIPKASRLRMLEEQNSNQKIVGGSVTDISQTPYQVSITHYCMFFIIYLLSLALFTVVIKANQSHFINFHQSYHLMKYNFTKVNQFGLFYLGLHRARMIPDQLFIVLCLYFMLLFF